MLKIIEQSPSSNGYYIVLEGNTTLHLAKKDPTPTEISDLLVSFERDKLNIDLLGEENDI